MKQKKICFMKLRKKCKPKNFSKFNNESKFDEPISTKNVKLRVYFKDSRLKSIYSIFFLKKYIHDWLIFNRQDAQFF